jgi:aldehyde:ferredoxin oxidoreductase
MGTPDPYEHCRGLINALYGSNLTSEECSRLGKQVLAMERRFNERAGFTEAHDRLPDWMYTDPLPPHGSVFVVPDRELDRVFELIE